MNTKTPCHAPSRGPVRLIRENILETESWNDIMVPIRRMEISMAESPFVLLSLHFSGPCDNQCPDCHSKALWRTEPNDFVSLGAVMRRMHELFTKMGIINGICILGTDNAEKAHHAELLIDFARSCGMHAIVFTGYDIDKALRSYPGADVFVCGRYRSGEWHENKRIYILTEEDDFEGTYTEISLDAYLNLS